MPPTLPDYTHDPIIKRAPVKKFNWLLLIGAMFGVLLVIGLIVMVYVQNLAKAPNSFPLNTPVEIVSGTSISAITKQLKSSGVVKSDLLLYVVLLSTYNPEDVKASTYYFETPKNVYEVAQALVQGDFDSDLISFIHFEGERATQTAQSAADQIEGFSATKFMNLASSSEGKLFPETYRIPKDFTEAELFALMIETYEKNLAPLRERLSGVNLSEAEVIILASIIEREANSVESMKLVSGILQNRLSIKMGLQVDASMEYVLNKPLKELTAEDLKKDSPYNTYLYRGLPPTAIGNPGLDAITAVLEPTPSPYMFYITGDDGNFYYAKDFEGHKRNITLYLN